MSRRVTPYVEEFIPPILDVNLRENVTVESSPLLEFLQEESIIDGQPCVTLTSDITMLFNQQRLDKMSQVLLTQYFADASKQSDSLAQLRSKLSDEQLAMFVKSRFIQSPSELQSWSQYLMDNYDSVSSEMQAMIDAQSAPSTDSPQQIETPSAE